MQPVINTSITKVVGIDTGVNTGFAVWCTVNRKLERVDTVEIGEALYQVYMMADAGEKVYVRIEDARLRKWFKESNIARKAQGAGSVKRDASVWQSWCETISIPYELVAPKNVKTKIDAKVFAHITGWDKSTTEHGRDAAMMVYNYNPMANILLKKIIQ
jgi:hypothetical protein